MREDDEHPAFVPLRPYAADEEDAQPSGSPFVAAPFAASPFAAAPFARAAAASGYNLDGPVSRARSFRPTPPSERREVGRVSLESESAEEATAGSLLSNAFLRQELEGGTALPMREAPDRFKGMSLKKFGLDGPPVPGVASQAGSNRPGPRQAKARKEGKSQDLMDLAFTSRNKVVDGQLKSNYAPISLPYYQDAAADTSKRDEAVGSRAHRPTMHTVDEKNANAAKAIFLSEQGDLQEQQLLLMQLPAILPDLLDPLEEVRREHEDDATAGAGAAITRLPDGHLGKLKIYKSGKVRMEIAGLEFCVDQGCDTFFRQDLACVCPLTKEIIGLGSISKRAVLTPDVAAMMAASASRVAAASSANAA